MCFKSWLINENMNSWFKKFTVHLNNNCTIKAYEESSLNLSSLKKKSEEKLYTEYKSIDKSMYMLFMWY